MSDNIKLVKQLLKNNKELSNEFGAFSKVYLSATENVAGILEDTDLNGKKVLTVAGSGDQALNLFFKGAEEVTLFDINPLAFLQNELKLAAAKALDYPDFCEYFAYGIGNVLNLKGFKKLLPYLDDDAADYYDFLYSNFSPLQIFHKTIFPFYPTNYKLERINNYMGEENFLELKEKIQDKKLKYIESDISELNKNLTEIYYAMLLSNISDSLEAIYPVGSVNSLKCYKRLIHVLSQYLERGGFIQCGYIYNNYRGHTDNPIFASDTIRKQIFDSSEFEEKDVESYQFYSSKDKVIIYQKKRRKAA